MVARIDDPGTVLKKHFRASTNPVLVEARLEG